MGAHTERVGAAITQFAGGNTKYFSTHHVELTKRKQDPACESKCVYG